MRRRRLLFLSLFPALAGLSCSPACAAEQPALELQVKAAFLYKFGGYVVWPERAFPAPDSPLVIGILGADALADELTQIVAGRMVNGRPVLARKLRNEDPITDVNMLFIGRASNDRIGEILAATKGQAVLTVSELENGLTFGSMINFVVVDGRVRFEVAPKAALLGNISISARLLAAAHKVVAAS